MATAPALVEPSPTTAFHCSAEWHLARLGRYAVPIHCLMLKVQGDDHFFGSEKQMAEYFRAGRRHIHDAVLKLIDLGFVLKIAARRGNSTIYRAITHKEWAESHPGRCVAKRDSIVGAPKGSMSPKGSPPVPTGDHKSPRKSPKKKRYDTALHAATSAFRLFQQSMDEETAFNLLRWILYRAAHPDEGKPGQVPQTVDYYTSAWGNFERQHKHGSENVLEEAEHRFDNYARGFLAEYSPDLLAWLEDKEAETYEASSGQEATDDDLAWIE